MSHNRYTIDKGEACTTGRPRKLEFSTTAVKPIVGEQVPPAGELHPAMTALWLLELQPLRGNCQGGSKSFNRNSSPAIVQLHPDV